MRFICSSALCGPGRIRKLAKHPSLCDAPTPSFRHCQERVCLCRIRASSIDEGCSAELGSVRIDLVGHACIDHVCLDSPDGDSGAAFAIVRAANLRWSAIAAVFCCDHSGQSESRSATIRPRLKPSFCQHPNRRPLSE
jgi:hypothetical protein